MTATLTTPRIVTASVVGPDVRDAVAWAVAELQHHDAPAGVLRVGRLEMAVTRDGVFSGRLVEGVSDDPR